MSETDDSKIAANLKCSDWQKRKQELLANSSAELWLKTYEEFFETRLETRYFKPIRKIAEDSELEGEGFSIMAILCTLVEFLEAIRLGEQYRYISREERKSGATLGPYEYDTSGEYFKNLLRHQSPFDEYFDTDDKAQNFYKNVRCGLLHEAQTKDGWRILYCSSKEKVVDFEQKIVYWEDFKLLVKKYLKNYSTKLSTDQVLQKAFTRKYDCLCRR